MAQFYCMTCQYEAHLVEFRIGTVEAYTDDGEEYREDELECPRCESEDITEL